MDYKKLGLKVGIEIHQQLNTNKLFCNCPSILREDNPHFKIKRNLHAVAGETGEIDIAAKEEQIKNLDFYYEGYTDTTCEVELDDQPPMSMNKEALETALVIAKILKSKVVDEIQVMRKIVVNGSNTSGFQRTSLVAIDGVLKTKDGNISIPTLCIEEDSCKDIEKTKNSYTFRLDRLGIPLVEIATGPDIKTPDQAKEVSEKLGLILRSSGKAMRGIGTIRQDLNINIKGTKRIEIKGAQDLKSIPKIIEYEVLRQLNLLEIKSKLSTLKPKLNYDFKDVSEIFKNSESKIIKNTFKNKGIILAVKLEKFNGLIGKEVQPGRRLGTEFSDRAKMIAGIGGIFHSDELPNYGVTEDDKKSLFRTLSCSSKDAFVLVATDPKSANVALTAVIDRAKEAILGVPQEVRKANSDNTSSYLRHMPGAARMYPETDLEPIIPDLKNIVIPELIEDKIKRYEKLELSHDLATLIGKSNNANLFDELISKYSIKPSFIAEIIESSPRIIRRKYKIEISPSNEDYDLIFKHLSDDKISKDSIIKILKENKPVKDVISKFIFISDKELEAEIKSIIKETKGLSPAALIGKTMAKLRGKADSKKIIDLLKKYSQI